MPNPHMGPDWPHRFKTDRDDPLTQHLQLKISKGMESRLKAMGKQKNEFIRQAIATALDTLDAIGEEPIDLGKLIAG